MNILYLQFFRHAEISPFTVYSNDPRINRIEDIWPYGFGKITKRSYNFTLPSWVVQIYDEISTAAQFWTQYYSYSNELKRLNVGPVFELLTENMRKKSIGELPEQKMFMYSYNGLFMASMLNTMGVFNGIEIPYTSLLMFELHQTGKNYFVKWFGGGGGRGEIGGRGKIGGRGIREK
ncbi:hypothetical protein Anas_10581 [Armadillidium nasatum]|uniref:Lysosomal acid phosphatase n=1 Tax=Armadillidium nasatum TaxID=96803 RepID=A0A5N5SSC5_9CRUS|nr:hypothetical protein Anas_10581 [Armadillidium nasatum]